MSKEIGELVVNLRCALLEKKLSADVVSSAIETLQRLGHKTYDHVKFPELKNTDLFESEVGVTPSNLSEALLWKLGKWPTYKTFVENYKKDNLEVSQKGGIVFSAFAKHLQDNSLPIYDQHAIRSIWAICELEPHETELCRKLLVDKQGSWKSSGSGDDGTCYELFLKKVNSICTNNRLSHRALDMLLMPLGQALKKETKSKRNIQVNKSELQYFSELVGIN